MFDRFPSSVRIVSLRRVASAVFLATALTYPASTLAQVPPTAPTACTDCHVQYDKPPEKGVLAELVANSVHGDMDCTDCHESASMDDIDSLAEQPHGRPVGVVDCGTCHDEVAETYVLHGRLEVGTAPDVPACWDCHGAHGVLRSSERLSSVHRMNLATTCMNCHTDVDLIKQHEILKDEPIKLYRGSVHGRVTEEGSYLAATCSDCHNAMSPDGTRTAHRILSPADPDSTINHFNIPQTCAACHRGATEDYWEGIHGQLARRGEVDAPVCTHCHGEHGILPASDLRSPVSAARLAQATCAPCHESASLNERYGVPAGSLKSYVDSYHGHKRQAGNVNIANCASCHGSHRILPSTNPRSPIHPDNLQYTCGECHPGISSELARASIHEPTNGTQVGWPRFFTVLYMWLIVLTIGGMLLHNLAHWIRTVRLRGRAPCIVRLTPSETMQHWLLMTSFIVLGISGFSLRFSDSWWVHLLCGWGGGEGFVIRGTVHRCAAVLFVIWAAWHLVYAITRRGRGWIRDMMAGKRDLSDLKTNVLFFLGWRKDPPRFGRFSYMEKAEYWALIWGGVVMTITGVLLWFDNFFIARWTLPKVLLDVALVVHYYEAWLASLAILVWHGYGVLFSPEVYPMNPAWISGKMPKSMYEHEHPEGPALAARTTTRAADAEENPEGAGRVRPNAGGSSLD